MKSSEIKELKYELKLEKLTFFRIFIVFICEIVFEFSFGIFFYWFTENDGYYGSDCKQLVYWTKKIWILYLIEACVALICFLIGLVSLFCYKKLMTKLYISFNNLFKTIIFLCSIVILTKITIIYQIKEDCNQLGLLTLFWLIFHYTLLGIALLAGIFILIITIIIYRRNKKKSLLDRKSLL
jgi:hypothetical protein